MNRKRRWVIQPAVIVYTIILCLLCPPGARIYGAEGIPGQPYNRLLFVIDVSNSMNHQDKDKLVHELVKMFVDSCPSARTEIGFVTYNDQILMTYPLTSMEQAEGRNSLKSELDKMQRLGSTDIGLALRYGMDIIRENPEENSRFAMILLSDGETDLGYSRTGRTMADSLADETAAYEKAKELNCPIYPVGISRDGSLSTEYLETIAGNTGGHAYEIQNAAGLPELYNRLFADVMGVAAASYEPVTGTGGEQSVAIEIPRQYANETGILLTGVKSPDNIRTDYAAPGLSLTQSKNYACVKLMNPVSDRITLYFTASAGVEIKPQAIHYIQVFPQVEIPQNLAAAELEIEARLYNINENRVITDQACYNGLTAQCLITDPETGENASLPMENTGSAFTLFYTNRKPKPMDFKVTVTGMGYGEQSPVQKLALTNTPPVQMEEFVSTLLKQSKELEFSLSDYFADSDGDMLSFELISYDKNITSAEIKDNGILALIPFAQGAGSMDIKVMDGRGGELLGNLSFKIVPFWIYYRTAFLGIGGIFIVLLTAYLLIARKRPASSAESVSNEHEASLSRTGFSDARFEGYFLNTKSGKEIPVLNWSAASIMNKKRVSLGELFFIMDVTENLPEAQKIFFDAGQNGTVIFHHDTNCDVNLGTKTISKGKEEVMRYGDKLYIMFEDHATEIEVRYRRAKRMVTA